MTCVTQFFDYLMEQSLQMPKQFRLENFIFYGMLHNACNSRIQQLSLQL